MKRFSFMVMIAIMMVLSFTACVGSQGPQGPAGEGTNWKIIKLVAPATAWEQFGDANNQNWYFTASFDVPEISDFVYKSGSVACYVVVDNCQAPLPYVRHYQDTEGNYWTTTTDYDYSVGHVNLYVTHNDFADMPPSDMEFRLVLMW